MMHDDEMRERLQAAFPGAPGRIGLADVQRAVAERQATRRRRSLAVTGLVAGLVVAVPIVAVLRAEGPTTPGNAATQEPAGSSSATSSGGEGQGKSFATVACGTADPTKVYDWPATSAAEATQGATRFQDAAASAAAAASYDKYWQTFAASYALLSRVWIEEEARLVTSGSPPEVDVSAIRSAESVIGQACRELPAVLE